MTDRPWLGSYPQGVPADIDASRYPSLVALMEESFAKYADRTAYSFMGKDLSYGEVDKLSRAFAAYLQGLGLAKGDRVAVMMPNCPQYPIAVRGHPARRADPGERQSALHAARARAPAQGLGLQGDRDHGELRQHAAAVHRAPRRSSTWC